MASSLIVRGATVLLVMLAVAAMIPAQPIQSAAGSWNSIGPEGGMVETVAIAPSNGAITYAGTKYHGVFRSASQASSWTNPAHNSNSFSPSSNLITVDPSSPNTVYEANNVVINSGFDIWFTSMRKSTDGSTTWTTIGSGLPSNPAVSAVVLHAANPNVVFASMVDISGFFSGGVWKSVNGGSSFTASSTGLPASPQVTALTIDPTTPTTLYAGLIGDVYKSVDSGGTWTDIGSGLPAQRISGVVVDPSTPSTLYAAVAWGGPGVAGGVYKTIDSGATWNPVITGLPASADAIGLSIAPSNPHVLYVRLTGGAIYRSTNDAGSWSEASGGLPRASGLGGPAFDGGPAVDPTNSDIALVGTDFGVYRTSNGGASWSVANSGLLAVNVTGLALDPTNVNAMYVGTTLGGIYKSTDAGSTWSPSNTGLPSPPSITALLVDPTNPNTLYIGLQGFFPYGGPVGLFKSTNGGATWTVMQNGIPMSRFNSFAIDRAHPATVYVAVQDYGVYKTTDGGANWSPASNGLPADRVNLLVIDPSNPNVLYAGTAHPDTRGGVWKTINGGANWTQLSGNLPSGGQPAGLVIDPVNPSTLYVALPSSAYGIWKTINGGNSWTQMNTGLTNVGVLALGIDPVNPAIVYAGTDAGQVFRTINGAATWSDFSTGLRAGFDSVARLPVSALAVSQSSPSQVRIGRSGDGVFAMSVPVEPTPTSTPTVTSTTTPTPTKPPGSTATATTTLSATPVDPCSPRPPVQIAAVPDGTGGLRATVTARTSSRITTNQLTELRLTKLSNATATLNGAPLQQGAVILLPANTQSLELRIQRAAAGSATTVEFAVVDACGPWPTFVGGGPGAF